jgi:hypothetical protein
MAGYSQKMADEPLSFKQRKQILKWYWQCENVFEIRREGRRKFATEPPTRLTIAQIRENFEADGTVHDVLLQKSGKS